MRNLVTACWKRYEECPQWLPSRTHPPISSSSISFAKVEPSLLLSCTSYNCMPPAIGGQHNARPALLAQEFAGTQMKETQFLCRQLLSNSCNADACRCRSAQNRSKKDQERHRHEAQLWHLCLQGTHWVPAPLRGCMTTHSKLSFQCIVIWRSLKSHVVSSNAGHPQGSRVPFPLPGPPMTKATSGLVPSTARSLPMVRSSGKCSIYRLKNIKNQPRFPCPSNGTTALYALWHQQRDGNGSQKRVARAHIAMQCPPLPHTTPHTRNASVEHLGRLCAKHPTAQKYSESVKTNRPQDPRNHAFSVRVPLYNPPAAIQHKNCWCLPLQLWVRNFLTRVTGAWSWCTCWLSRNWFWLCDGRKWPIIVPAVIWIWFGNSWVSTWFSIPFLIVFLCLNDGGRNPPPD